MKETELTALWKAYDQKLEEHLQVNRQHAADITRLKVQSALSSMKPSKIFTLFIGLIWVSLGSTVVFNLAVYAPDKVSIFFLLSAGFQLILTAIALVVYLYQLILIRQVDISEPVLAVQERLARLRSSTLQVTRILFLQLPAWTTFFWSESMFEHNHTSLLILPVAITLIFTAATPWLFFNIKYENRDKWWFRFIFSGKEWDPILQAMEMLEQLKGYQKT